MMKPVAMDLASLDPATVIRPSTVRRRYWRSERVWFDGDSWFDALLADIAAARRTVDLETYIFADDHTGARVLAALRAAAARGVHVRLLVDGVGAGLWLMRRAAELHAGGTGAREAAPDVRVFHPLPWLLFSRAYRRTSRLWAMFRLLLRINRRDHRKLCIIDQHAAWIGSFNVTDDHVGARSGERCWRDTGARVEGTAVRELVDAFNHTWRRSWRLGRARLRPPELWRGRRPLGASGLVRINTRLADRRGMYRELLHRIDGARRRVWITAAYFVPNRRLVAALGRAARNGVDVRMLVPAKSDVVFMPWVAAAFYDALLKEGVRIFEYQPRVLHAKTVLIDDWLTVGSTNLNYRSLLHDLEVEVVLLHPRTHRLLERAFLADLDCAREVTTDDWRRRPWLHRWMGRQALRLRRWL